MSDQEYYRQKAAEMRALAESARDPLKRDQFLALAQEYEVLRAAAPPRVGAAWSESK